MWHSISRATFLGQKLHSVTFRVISRASKSSFTQQQFLDNLHNYQGLCCVLQLSEKQLKTEPHQRSFFLRDGVLNLNSATLLLR